MKKQYLLLSFINLFISVVLIMSKLTLGEASEIKPIIDNVCPSSLLPSSEGQYAEVQQTIETFIKLSQVIEDNSASSVFVVFAKVYLGEDVESFMGSDWKKNIVRHTQSWKKQDAIDFLIFLVKRIGIDATLNTIKSTSSLRWIRYRPFKDKLYFLEQYLGVDTTSISRETPSENSVPDNTKGIIVDGYTNMLKKTPLKDFAPNNVQGIRDNIKKIEPLIGRKQTVQLIEDDFSALTVINTEIDNIEQYLREDRAIPTETIREMMIRNTRAFMNASLHYMEVRFSYLERMSGLSKEDTNQMMIDNPLAFIKNYFSYNRSPLHISVYIGDINLASSLINEDTVNAVDIEHWTPLHVTSYTGDKNLASLLIENEADVNSVDNAGLTPLHVAVYQQNKDIVSLLLEHEASIDIPDKAGWMPLFLAVYNRDIDMVTLLLNAGADINYRDPNTGWTALHFVLYIEDIALASLLVEHGADVSIADNKGLSPLYIAAYIGDVDLISLMMKYGGIHLQVFQTMRSPIKGSLLYWALYGTNSVGVLPLLMEYRNEIVVDKEELTEEERSTWIFWINNWFLNGNHKIIEDDRYKEQVNKEYQDRENATINMLDKQIDSTLLHRLLNNILYQEPDRDKRIEELLAALRKLNNPDRNSIDNIGIPIYWSFYSAAEEVISFIKENYHPRSVADNDSTNTE